MDTPPPPPSTTLHQPQPPTTTTHPIPLTSPLRTHPKRLLPPPLFTSTYPHGLISGLPRSPAQQAALDSRKSDILRTMSKKDIERAYEEIAGRIRKETEEGERRGREVEGEMERLGMEREMERRVWGKLRGGRGGG